MLVIGHEVAPKTVPVQAGTLATWAADRGVTVVPGVAGDELPDPHTVGAVAVLGSPQGISWSRSSWGTSRPGCAMPWPAPNSRRAVRRTDSRRSGLFSRS